MTNAAPQRVVRVIPAAKPDAVDRLRSSAEQLRVVAYLYLRERSNKDSTCFPSIPTVSRDTGLSEATVKRAIQDLIAAGWLQKEPRLRRNGARSSNLYLLKH